MLVRNATLVVWLTLAGCSTPQVNVTNVAACAAPQAGASPSRAASAPRNVEAQASGVVVSRVTCPDGTVVESYVDAQGGFGASP